MAARRGLGHGLGSRYLSTASRGQGVKRLIDDQINTFRNEAFDRAVPALLPPGTFKHIPAASRWFTNDIARPHRNLNYQYLSAYSDTVVPLELTSPDNEFMSIHEPLSLFLNHAFNPKVGVSMYLAQASIADLPPALAADLPTPEYVRTAGRGDVYASSIWLGRPPTYTPLHRDPNPNLFVQLAGEKRVRLMRPDVGMSVYEGVQQEIGADGHARFRGAEMMAGLEREELDRVVWGDRADLGRVWECRVRAGDGLFIPKGWWHSVKSTGSGMNGSVNWWFR